MGPEEQAPLLVAFDSNWIAPLEPHVNPSERESLRESGGKLVSQLPKVAVYGAGGHGRTVADALFANGVPIAGFIDDGMRIGTTVMGAPVLDVSAAREANFQVALGIGDNFSRARVANDWSLHTALRTVIHPRATVSCSASLSEGVVVFAGAVVNPSAKILRGAIVNSSAVVEHDCLVGCFAHVAPNATLTGGACIGDYTQVGAGAVLLPGVRVGTECIVGAGAVVREDVPDGTVVAGVPARVLRTTSPRGR